MRHPHHQCCISSGNPSTDMPILLLLMSQQKTPDPAHAYILYIYTTIIMDKSQSQIQEKQVSHTQENHGHQATYTVV